MSITFRSEAEKNEAINRISTDPADAPLGVSIEEFLSQSEAKIDEILAAPIVESSEPQEHNSDIQVPSSSNTIAQELQSQSPVDSELENLRRRNEALQQQRDEMAAAHSEELEKIKSTIQSSPVVPDKQDLPIDSEIKDIQNKIDELEAYMNKDDLDIYDEEYSKKSRSLLKYSVKLTSLLNQRNQEIISKHQSELNDVKNQQKIERENEKKIQNRKKIYEEIDDFRKDVPELKGRKYEEMDTEYTEFSKELGAIWYGTTPDKVDSVKAEIAVNKYMEGNPELHERCKQKGLSSPQGLEQYIVLSDVNALKIGYVLDKKTGKWNAHKDVSGRNIIFPDFESAWNYYKKKNTLPKKLEFDKVNQGAKQVLEALNKRASVVELDEVHRNNDIVAMSREAASNVVSKYSEEYIAMKARRNFNDPEVQEYNKALGVLGEAKLSMEDFE